MDQKRRNRRHGHHRRDGLLLHLVDADEGRTIKVKVSFADDVGNEQTLTSQATIEVASRRAHGTAGAP